MSHFLKALIRIGVLGVRDRISSSSAPPPSFPLYPFHSPFKRMIVMLLIPPTRNGDGWDGRTTPSSVTDVLTGWSNNRSRSLRESIIPGSAAMKALSRSHSWGSMRNIWGWGWIISPGSRGRLMNNSLFPGRRKGSSPLHE